MRNADKAFLAVCAVVAGSTAGLPFVWGYGTVLFQLVVFSAWDVAAKLSSGTYADQHHELLWTIALFVNLLCFCIVAVPMWLATRKRLPRISVLSIIGWTVLYVAMLFVLFPATEGP
jgi:hypothetical protein